MKLVLAIVHNDDSPLVTAQLTKAGVATTKIATTGGFLMSGNTTFITGVPDEKVGEVVDIISKYSKKRKQPAPPEMIFNSSAGIQPSMPAEVFVGGGTIFVLNVENFYHV